MNEIVKRGPGRPRKAPPLDPQDYALLTEDDKKRIRDKAEAQAVAERKLRAEEAVFLQYQSEARAKYDPDEEDCTFTLDLPEHSDRIMLDGTIYFQSQTYTVKKRVFDSLREIVARAWRHQSEVDGKLDSNQYRRPMNRQFSGRMAA